MNHTPYTARRRTHASTWTRLRGGWWLAGIVALLAVFLLVRKPLAERLWPETRAQQLEGQAALALERGVLTAADGSGARELYVAAMAIDPDRLQSRAGLVRVGEAALERAQDDIAARRFDQAHALVGLARELAVPRERIDAVAALLRTQEAAHAGIDELLARAEDVSLTGQLEGEGGALPLYARVLELQPGHADALRGREDALGVLLDRARAQLREGDMLSAATLIASVRGYDPGHVDLPDARARLTEELDALHSRADADLRAGRIERALERWQQLLRLDPADADAQAGLRRVAEAQAARAIRLAADSRFADADAMLAQASALAPGSEAVREATVQVERARALRARPGTGLDAAELGRRVATLLEQADAARRRGDLLTPPGESAYDRLRVALALAPQDPAVREASAQLLSAARDCFERNLSANSLGRAAACLDAGGQLGESDAAQAQARRRLALRWLAIGDERLGAGDVESAAAALASARNFDPAVPGLVEFEQRLNAARR